MRFLHQHRWSRIVRVGLPGILAIVLAAGCGGSSGGSKSSAASSGGGASSSSGQSNSTLVVAEPNDMQNLDPTLSSADVTTQEMLTNVYGWLVNYKVENSSGQMIGEPNSFVPSLAQSMSWNAAHTVLTFQLRHDLKFANGDPINAQAVKYTYDRVYKQAGVTSALISMAAVKDQNSITTSGQYTVQFHLTKANDLLFGNMAQFGNSILDPKVVEAHVTSSDPFAHNWLGTHVGGTAQGPYELQSWTPGVEWVLTANPNYTYGPAPKIKKIIFKVIPDPSTRYELLTSGAVDMAFDLPLKDIQAAKGNSSITVVNEPSRQIVFLGMNSSDKPFNNVQVRQAIDYAIPYKTIIQQVLDGYGEQMTSPVPTGTPTHTSQFDYYSTNMAKAKALLKAAGYGSGFSTKLAVSSGNEEGQETAIWVQQALKPLGINVTIDTMPGATYTAELQKHQLPFFFFNNWISINNDPFYHLYWLFDSACCDYTNYDNATVKNTINANLVTPTGPARDAASVKVQQMIMQDAPWAFLYQPNFVLAMRSDVKGYVYFPADTFTRYQYLYKTGS